MNLALKLGIFSAGIGGGIFVLNRASQSPDADNVASDLLEKVDRNGDDALDGSEASHFESRYFYGGLETSSTDAKRFLTVTDTDRDGRATRDEIKGWLELQDTNHDGQIQRSERRAAAELAWPRVSDRTYNF